MRKEVLTEEMKKFIRANRLNMSARKMALKYGVGACVVSRFINKNGLKVSKEKQEEFRIAGMVGKTTSTPEMDAIIKKEYLNLPSKALARKLNKSDSFVTKRLSQLGLVIPKELIEKRKKASQIKPGNIPQNKGRKQSEYMTQEAIDRTKKTRFKKGIIPYNTKDRNGVISTRWEKGRPYQYIRIEMGNWQPLHKELWERTNGTYNSNTHCLWFKDGNSLNIELDNMELITRKENMRRNSITRFPAELRKVISLNKKLKKQINGSIRKRDSAVPE